MDRNNFLFRWYTDILHHLLHSTCNNAHGFISHIHDTINWAFITNKNNKGNNFKYRFKAVNTDQIPKTHSVRDLYATVAPSAYIFDTLRGSV